MSQTAGLTIRQDPVADATRDVSAPPPASAEAWSHAPFDRAVGEEMRALLARLAPAQRLWLSGYLAGSLAGTSEHAAPAAKAATAPVVILFGSQSGNSESLAKKVAQRLDAGHTPHRVLDMLDCRKADLEQAQQLIVIVSTHGDGDAPERAAPFFELLFSRKAPQLSRTRFAVLALGDTSYEHFCAAGQRVDARLAELGAQRLQPRVDCDVDFDAPASGWIESIIPHFADAAEQAATGITAARETALPSVAHAWTRKNPFHAEILANQALTAHGSTKDVRHLELSLPGSEIQYTPGDALGIVPRNVESEIDALLAQLHFPGDAPVLVGEKQTSLRTALLQHCEIGVLTAPFLRRYAEASRHTELTRLAGDAAALRKFLHGRDLRDVLAEYPPRDIDAATFARLLAPLAPRLYSIASSSKATPDEVHLTIGVVRYEAQLRARQGVVSGALATLEDGTLPVYLHRNEGFRLPADPNASIVMIGAGTGIAPYRGFLADREATGTKGKNWLVFGDRSFELDFLYQSEWLSWRKRGLLSRLDVAFSRDQQQKLYVQHRLLEHGAALWQWLQEGAHLYLCGDAEYMAPDVERALLAIAQEHGGLAEEAGRDYLLQLQRARRYQKDVY